MSLRTHAFDGGPLGGRPPAADEPAAAPRATGAHVRKPWLDRAAVAGFAGIWALAFTRRSEELFDPDLAAGNLAGLAAGYLLADLVAGTVHWIADRHFDPETRWIGKLLIEPFRAHHEDPASITRHDFFEVLGNNALVAIPATAGLLFVPAPESQLGAFTVSVALAGTLAAVATNLFHGWAHASRPPRIARWLQARGLILTPRRHAVHHQAEHDRAYCVTSGWLNPLLDRTRLFARLDAWIEQGARTRSRSGSELRPLASPPPGRDRTSAR